MTNLVDVGIHPSNISRIVNAINYGEGCEEVSDRQRNSGVEFAQIFNKREKV